MKIENIFNDFYKEFKKKDFKILKHDNKALLKEVKTEEIKESMLMQKNIISNMAYTIAESFLNINKQSKEFFDAITEIRNSTFLLSMMIMPILL